MIRIAVLAGIAAISLVGSPNASAKARRLPRGKALPPATSHQVSPIVLSDVPEGQLPAAFDPTPEPGKPLVLPTGLTNSDEIDIVSLDPSQPLKVLRKRQGAGAQVQLKMAGGGPGIFVQHYAGQPGYQSSQAEPLMMSCGTAYSGYPPTPIRWERFHVDADGTAQLDVTDGFFAMGECAVKTGRKTTLHPKPLLSVGGLAVAYGLKTDGVLTVFVPREAAVAADTSSQDPEALQGALWSVAMPLRKGVSSSMEVQFGQGTMSRFVTESRGKTAPIDPSADMALVFGIDAVQSVSDAEPTVVAHLSTH